MTSEQKVRAAIWYPENSRIADVNIQKSLVLTAASKESQTDQNETALHLAARYSRADVVKRLLDNATVDVNSRDQHNRTPLHLAIGADALEVFQVNI